VSSFFLNEDSPILKLVKVITLENNNYFQSLKFISFVPTNSFLALFLKFSCSRQYILYKILVLNFVIVQISRNGMFISVLKVQCYKVFYVFLFSYCMFY
jgi:hypothetical protein